VGGVDLLPELAHVTCPVLVVAGDLDPVCGAGYGGSIRPHQNGSMWLHSVDHWTVRGGPVQSSSEKKQQIKAGARPSRHRSPPDRCGPVQTARVEPQQAATASGADAAAELVAAFPAGLVRLCQFPGAGHHIHRDQPDRFFPLLRRFVAGHVAPAMPATAG
jgi:pimeloyl-ACP methyl ester carboxylesterase